MDWIDGHPDESETFYTQTITVSQSKLPVVVQPGGWLMEHNGNWMKGAKIVDVRQLLGGNLIITVTEVIERRVHDMGVGKLWFVSGKDQ
ncbi:hypothetical protein [Maritalea myrionectae]|nr:hypothetical protein [Maritalea myrionectae]